jgi:hypothetical protein
VAGVSVGVAVAEPAPVVAASTQTHGQAQDQTSATSTAKPDGQPRPSSTSAKLAQGHGPTAAPAKPTSPAVSRDRRHAARAAHTKPYIFYDSLIPAAVPADKEVATYADGARPVPPAAVAGRTGPVLWIDVTGGDPQAPILDVEPGNASPSVVASWVWRRLTAEPGSHAIIYTMIDEWPAAKAAVATLPVAMQAQVRWWIADPTGYAHVVPGSDATQWYWGRSYDISTANPDF